MSPCHLIGTTPSVGWTITILAVQVLVVVPLVLWGLARTAKRGLAWVLLPLVSSVAAVGLWLYVDQQVHP